MMEKDVIKQSLLNKGIYYFTRTDIVELYNEALHLRRVIYIKFSIIAPSTILLIALTLLLTKDLMTPKVGDIGVYTPDGETSKLNSIINPSPTKENAFNYALAAAIEIRTFFFSTYFKDITKLEGLFTTEAYNDYLLSLNDSGMFNKVRAESLNVTAAESPRNTINAKFSIEGGKNYFYVRIRLILRIESLSGEDEFSTEELFFKLQEVDRGSSKYGLLISSLEPF